MILTFFNTYNSVDIEANSFRIYINSHIVCEDQTLVQITSSKMTGH